MDRSVRDDTGRRLELTSSPSRLVSLVPSVTEILFTLGVDDRIVGISDYCNHPPGAAGKEKVGGVLDPDLDRVLSLSPDLVIVSVSENRPETVEAVEREGVLVYVTDPRSVDGAIRSMEGIVSLLGSVPKGSDLPTRLEGELASLETSATPLRVFFPVWEDPLISPGRGTFVADLLRRGGALSVTESLGSGWPSCGLDFLRTGGAEAVILPSEPLPYDEEDRVRWEKLEGLPERLVGRIFLVDGELTNRPGPRMIHGVRAIREIVDAVESGSRDGDARVENHAPEG